MSDFVLDNESLFRSYLAHIQRMVRQRAGLLHELVEHPDFHGEIIPNSDPLRKSWEMLARDTEKVLGVQLVPFNELVKSGTFTRHPSTYQEGAKDELRITMRVLKARADKARRKDPSITLMKSWSLLEHERIKD